MTIRLKTKTPYWQEFSMYQTFESVKEMNAAVKQFVKLYVITPAIKAVLNTIKLHSKTFPGVCWLYREEIARKAKVSLSSVKRAIKELKEIGLLKIYEQNHTLRGGQTHNVYVINPIFEPASEPANEPPSDDFKMDENLDAPTVTDVEPEVHKNLYKNSNTSLNHLSIKKNEELKFIPNEFIDLMEPFYANNPEIIRDRWKTVCVAVKKNCGSFARTSWDTVGKAWKDTVSMFKRGKIKMDTDNGVGGYFYGVLCDYLMDDYFRSFSR